MFGGILHRMILRELTKVFLLSLVGITGILLMAGIVAEATQHGLGPGQILKAIPLLIPSTLPYTIPATTLFAACVVYGRLAADNEILAIKAAGINLYRVVLPGLLLGLMISGGTMALYYRVIPYTHRLLREMVFNDAEELLYSLLRKHSTIQHGNDAMWVRAVQDRRLLNPTFKRRKPDGQLEIVVQAREADLRVNFPKRLLLIHMRHGVASSEDGSHAYFDNRVIEVPLPEDFIKRTDRRARDMTWQEILERKQELFQERDHVSTELEQARSYLGQTSAPESLAEHIKNLENVYSHTNQQLRLLDVEMYMRPALALGCFCFILVGCPVGIWFSRSDFLSSFITCFLPIVCIYYPLMLCGTGMAKEGKLDPFLLVWGANLVIGFIGLILFTRLLRN